MTTLSKLVQAAAVTAALLLPSAARAEWLQVTSPNFILYTDTAPASAKRYAETLEMFDAVLRDRHGLPVGTPARRKLPIYLLRRDDDMRRISPGISSTIAGFYMSELEDTFAVATETRRANSTLLHEYVHHFMLAHFPYNYPGWLIEGYAEYFMTFKLDAENFEIGNVNQNRANWLSQVNWIPFDLILKSRSGELKTNEQRAMYYAQSWALTHYFLRDPGRRKQLDAYIKAVGAGADPVQAMKDASGQTPASLSKTVRSYLTRGFPYQRFGRGTLAAPAITVTELPPGSGDLLLMAQRIKGDNGEDAPQDKTDGPVRLAAARKAAAASPGQRLAHVVQARAEIKLGDLAVADRLLTAQLEKTPQDAEVLEVLAQQRLKAAEAEPNTPEGAKRATALRAEARAFAGRAHKADPNHYQTLIAYAQGREGAAGYPKDNDLEVLRDALELAPQVDSLRLKTAQALAHREKWAEAARVLRPLAFDPHAGGGNADVRALLTMLETMAAGGATTTPAAAGS